MKIIALFTCVLTGFFSIGQKSYYFSEPLPLGGQSVQQVDSRYFGRYYLPGGGRSYEVSADGIAVVSTIITSIDRKTIRESSKYDVRNDYIFGVVKNDSVPCVLQDDRYYFGVRNRELLAGLGAPHTLKPLGNGEYLLNFAENDVYTPAILKFSADRLEIGEFSYDLETSIFDTVQNKRTVPDKVYDLVILSPSQEEFETLRKAGIFDEVVTLKKETDQ